MSDEHDLSAILQQALEAFNQNDLEAISTYVAADVTYTIHGRASVSGTYRGVEGFRRALKSIKDLTDGTMKVQPELVLTGHNAVMVYMRVTGARKDGRRHHSHEAHVYRFRDGKVFEGQAIPVDQLALEKFFQD